MTHQEAAEPIENDVLREVKVGDALYFVYADSVYRAVLAGSEADDADGYIVRASTPREAVSIVRTYLEAPGLDLDAEEV